MAAILSHSSAPLPRRADAPLWTIAEWRLVGAWLTGIGVNYLALAIHAVSFLLVVLALHQIRDRPPPH